MRSILISARVCSRATAAACAASCLALFFAAAPALAVPIADPLPPRIQLSDFAHPYYDSVSHLQIGDGFVMWDEPPTAEWTLYDLDAGTSHGVSNAFRLSNRTIYLARDRDEHTQIYAMDAGTGWTRLHAELPGPKLDDPLTQVDVAGDFIVWWSRQLNTTGSRYTYDLWSMVAGASQVTSLTVNCDFPLSLRASAERLAAWESRDDLEGMWIDGPSGIADLDSETWTRLDRAHGFDTHGSRMTYRDIAWNYETGYTETLWLYDCAHATSSTVAADVRGPHDYPVSIGIDRGPALSGGRIAWNLPTGLRIYDLETGTYTLLDIDVAEFDIYGDDLVYVDANDWHVYWQPLSASTTPTAPQDPAPGSTAYAWNSSGESVEPTASVEITRSAEPTHSANPDTPQDDGATTDPEPEPRSDGETGAPTGVTRTALYAVGLLALLGIAAWVARMRRTPSV